MARSTCLHWVRVRIGAEGGWGPTHYVSRLNIYPRDPQVSFMHFYACLGKFPPVVGNELFSYLMYARDPRMSSEQIEAGQTLALTLTLRNPNSP